MVLMCSRNEAEPALDGSEPVLAVSSDAELMLVAAVDDEPTLDVVTACSTHT